MWNLVKQVKKCSSKKGIPCRMCSSACFIYPSLKYEFLIRYVEETFTINHKDIDETVQYRIGEILKEKSELKYLKADKVVQDTAIRRLEMENDKLKKQILRMHGDKVVFPVKGGNDETQNNS